MGGHLTALPAELRLLSFLFLGVCVCGRPMRPTGNERGLCALPLRLDLDKEFLFPSQKSKPKQEAVTLRERAEVTIIWLDCLMQRSGSSHGGNVLCSQKDG